MPGLVRVSMVRSRWPASQSVQGGIKVEYSADVTEV